MTSDDENLLTIINIFFRDMSIQLLSSLFKKGLFDLFFNLVVEVSFIL